jgi:hypothetical protein
MNEADTIEYLSRLLNRPVTPEMSLSLTSGQRARFLGWIERAGASPDLLRGVLSRAFSVRQLLGQAHAAEPSGSGADTASAIAPPAGTPSAGSFAGVGIDIQRVAEILPYDDAFDFGSASAPVQTLGGLFAAKEAIIKADAARSSLKLCDIEVLPDERGVPTHEGFQLSVSHSGEYAIAVALKLAPLLPAAGPGLQALAPSSDPTPVSPGTPRSRGLGVFVWVILLALAMFGTGVLFAKIL